MMKIAVLCDFHLPDITGSVPYCYFDRAVAFLKGNKTDYTVVAGDITASGEMNAFRYYQKFAKQLGWITVLGNSDVRNRNEELLAFARGGCFKAENRTVLCLNVTDGTICLSDRERISALCDGDILIIHFSYDRLCKDEQCFFDRLLAEKNITVIHGHKHFAVDQKIGKGRFIGCRALDPDKSVGAPPCITLFDLTDNAITYREQLFVTEKEKMKGFRDLIGISCFDVVKATDAAMKYGIKNLELRKYSESDGLFDETVRCIGLWRQQGGKNLSIHMPHLFWKGGTVDCHGWKYAARLAYATGVNNYTMHPPKESIITVKEHFDEFCDYYYDFIDNLPKEVTVGIENIHRYSYDPLDEQRKYGGLPDQVNALIDAINSRFGYTRVGSVLDVGHARNNPPFNQYYTNSMWYEIMGRKTVAYHIHQITRTPAPEYKMINHTGIECWFGPMISYSSFFYGWANGILNQCPMFLEVKDIDGSIKSIESFDNITQF